MLKNIDCCGCSACLNICPHNAITMKENAEGFLYPYIDEEKCKNCGLCKKVCPSLNIENKNIKKPDCYAAMADDEIRLQSSSGGAFSIIASHILNNNGYVCGCTFDTDDLTAKHIIIDSINDLSKLRGSKYVQSNVQYSYKNIKTLINDGKFVLFSGTPCQVAALKAYLNKDYDNLLTIDILCHGVGSPKVYRKYLKEYLKSEDEKIINVQFRDKVNGWKAPLVNTTTTTTTTYSHSQITDNYYQVFLKNIALRKNCANCKYCSTQRQGDITLGDFWRVDVYNKNLDDNKGTSLVLINNKKAEKIFNELKNDFITLEKVPLKYAIAGNRNLHSPSKQHPKRTDFFSNLDNYSMKQLVNMYILKKYDCGIMNYWASWNYGAIMTCYALQELIKSLGYTVQVINYRAKMWNNKRLYPQSQVQYDFVKKYLNLTKVCKNKKELSTLNKTINTFISGSDQVWHWWYTLQYLYFFDFVNDDKKKIACSASMVHELFAQSDDVKLAIEYYMKRFDAISVREAESVPICRKEFDVDATCILDPVFLIDKKYYNDIVATSLLKDDNYIFVYTFERGTYLIKLIEVLSEKYNSKIVWVKRGGAIEDWLYYIKNAKYIITDSYHGTCFSIIYNKPFIALVNSRGNSRFNSLLTILNLKDKLATDKNDVNKLIEKALLPVDYNSVNEILNSEKDKSINWLKNALKKPKDKFKESVESRFFRMLYKKKRIPKGIPNYLIKLKNRGIKFAKNFYHISKIKLYLITGNINILK